MMRFLKLGVLCLGMLVAACSSGKGGDPVDVHVAVTGISLSKTSATLSVGEEVVLAVTVLPENASNKKILWTSDNASVAAVVDGKVTGVAAGTATITATSEDGGKKATCVVTVTASIDLNGEWKLVSWLGAADLAGKVYLKFNTDKSFVMYQNLDKAGFTRLNGTYEHNVAQNTLSGTYSDGVAWKRSYAVNGEGANRMLLLDKQDAADITVYDREAIPDYVKDAAAAAPTRAGVKRFL